MASTRDSSSAPPSSRAAATITSTASGWPDKAPLLRQTVPTGSRTAAIALGTVAGFGALSYTLALDAAAKL